MTSIDLANAVLTATKAALDGGTLFIFAGPVPPSADAALDMVNDHTQCGAMAGINFDAPVNGVLPKDPGETWDTLIAFDGAQDGQSTLEPTFYRFCASGDNGRGAGTGPRLQGTVGGPTSGARLAFDAAEWIDNASNTKGVGMFNVTASQL